MNNTYTSLAELVRNHPLSTAFLNEHHIDYCCNGADSVIQAVAEQGYEVSTFLNKLEAYLAQQEAKYTATIDEELYRMSVSDLIVHLEATHHRDERNLIAQVDEKLTTILSVHYTAHKEELIHVFKLFCDLRKELLVHFVQEEEEVFPLMGQKRDEASIAKVRALEADHVGAGDLIKELQKATNDFTPPNDVCPTYVAAYALLKQLVEDIFLHIYKENSILFPKYEEGATA